MKQKGKKQQLDKKWNKKSLNIIKRTRDKKVWNHFDQLARSGHIFAFYVRWMVNEAEECKMSCWWWGLTESFFVCKSSQTYSWNQKLCLRQSMGKLEFDLSNNRCGNITSELFLSLPLFLYSLLSIISLSLCLFISLTSFHSLSLFNIGLSLSLLSFVSLSLFIIILFLSIYSFFNICVSLSLRHNSLFLSILSSTIVLVYLPLKHHSILSLSVYSFFDSYVSLYFIILSLSCLFFPCLFLSWKSLCTYIVITCFSVPR